MLYQLKEIISQERAQDFPETCPGVLRKYPYGLTCKAKWLKVTDLQRNMIGM